MDEILNNIEKINFLKMDDEQKIDYIIKNYYDNTTYILCLLSYYMGKAKGLEKNHESNNSC